jgi:hypothetical protein
VRPPASRLGAGCTFTSALVVAGVLFGVLVAVIAADQLASPHGARGPVSARAARHGGAAGERTTRALDSGG